MANARIRVKRLVNLGNFEHISLEEEQDCRGPKATPSEVTALVETVNERAHHAKVLASAQNSLFSAEEHLEHLKEEKRAAPTAISESDVEDARESVKKAKLKVAGAKQRLKGQTLDK